MKLLELVSLMNIADVTVGSYTIRGFRSRALDMFHMDTDPTLRRYGDREIESITDVCHLGVTIWIK